MRKNASQTAPTLWGRCLAAAARLARPRDVVAAGGRRLAAWSLAAGAIAAAATPAFAQAPPTYPAAPYAGPGVPAGPQMSPVYSQNPETIWPQAAGPNYHPYPKISPYGDYNVLATKHENRGGQWFKTIYQKDRQSYFRTEASSWHFDEAGSEVVGSEPLPGAVGGLQIRSEVIRSNPNEIFVIGDDDGNGANIDNLAVGGLGGVLDQLPPDFFFIGPGTFPYPLQAVDAVPTTGADLEAFVRNDIHPVRTVGNLGDASSLGVRLTTGWDNGDGSGVEFFGVFSGNADFSYRRGQNEYRGMPVTASLVDALPTRTLSILNGAIPLDTGLPTFPAFGDALKVNGFAQKYDVYYGLDNTIAVYGGGLLAFSQTLVDRDAFRLRMFYGAEYMHVDEEFGFRGIDSGASIIDEDFQADGGLLPGGTQGGGGGTTTVFGSQPLGRFLPIPALTPGSPDQFFEAELNSTVKTHLAGPTVGLRYEFGSERGAFQLAGTTTLGLLANHERKTVFGENIGEQTAMKTLYGIDFLSDPATGVLLPDGATAFRDEQDTTHVSPMFRQDIDGSLAVGSIIPPLKDTSLFDDARLTFGYRVMLIGEVQRAGDGIAWRGFPQFPSARSNRTSLLTQEAKLGLEWNY